MMIGWICVVVIVFICEIFKCINNYINKKYENKGDK